MGVGVLSGGRSRIMGVGVGSRGRSVPVLECGCWERFSCLGIWWVSCYTSSSQILPYLSSVERSLNVTLWCTTKPYFGPIIVFAVYVTFHGKTYVVANICFTRITKNILLLYILPS